MNAHSKTASLAGRGGSGNSKGWTPENYQLRATLAIRNVPDLGDWRDIGEVTHYIVARLIASRYRVSPERARVIRELAGLGRRAAQ